LKRIKDILKSILIFIVVVKYQLLIKIMGINFCIRSLAKDNFKIKIDPKYLCKSLNSNLIVFLKPSCLVKSLTFKKLARSASEFILVIGASKKDGVFESHAWIEKNNIIVLNPDPNIDKFKKIFSYE